MQLDKLGYKVTKTIAKHKEVVVYYGYQRETRIEVALKLVDRAASADTEPREIRILKLLQGLHHTQKFIDWHALGATSCFCLITEYIYPAKPSGKEEIKGYMLHTLQALLYCHENTIIHRDVKPPNVIFCRNTRTAILIDFDCAKVFDPDNPPVSEVGTPGYMAQEILDLKAGTRTEGYDYAVDVWSAGIVFAELLFASRLRKRVPSRTRILRMISEAPRKTSAHRLLKDMLNLDPKERITVGGALCHPYFTKGLDEEEVQARLRVKRWNKKM